MKLACKSTLIVVVSGSILWAFPSSRRYIKKCYSEFMDTYRLRQRYIEDALTSTYDVLNSTSDYSQ